MLVARHHGYEEHEGLEDDDHQHRGDEVGAIALGGVVERCTHHGDGTLRGGSHEAGQGLCGDERHAVGTVDGLHDLEVGLLDGLVIEKGIGGGIHGIHGRAAIVEALGEVAR